MNQSKRSVLTLGIILLLIFMGLVYIPPITSGNAENNQDEYSDSLVAYWKFDELSGTEAEDSIGGNTGTLTNGPVWSEGKIIGGLEFDGVDDYVRVSHADCFNTTKEITLEAWIYPYESYSGSIISKMGAPGDWVLKYNNDIVFLAIDNNWVIDAKISENTWNHIVVTYNEPNVKLYINGDRIESETTTHTLQNNTNDIFIGSSSITASHFNGMLDEIAVYTQALSDCEVRRQYHNSYIGKNYNANGDSIKPIGLVSYWRFDDGFGSMARDSLGSNHGTVHGANWVDGLVNGALEFDGINDYISVPDDPSLDLTSSLTLEAWIKPITTSGKFVIYKSDIPSGGVYSLNFFTGHARATIKDSSSEISTIAMGTTSIVSNEWQHIAVTWNGSMIKIFYNGHLNGSKSFTGTIETSDGDLEIGRYTNYFDGIMDEVAIFNRSLTESEIFKHYKNGIFGEGYCYTEMLDCREGLISEWTFDHGSGTIAHDSVNWNYGTIHGASWTEGIVNDALSFDGYDDYVEIEHNQNLNTVDMSFELWVNATTASSFLLSKYTKSSGFFIREVDNKWIFHLNGTVVISLGEVEVGQWTYLAGTYDGKWLKIYYNGVCKVREYEHQLLNSNTEKLLIGSSGVSFFNGKIDEIRLWERVLTAEEIYNTYRSVLPQISPEGKTLIDPLMIKTKFDGERGYVYLEDDWYRLDGAINYNWEWYFPDLYDNTENITNFLTELDIPTTPTNDDDEIWSRLGQVWTWLKTHRALPSHENYSAAVAFYDTWLDENDGFMTLDAFTGMCLEYKIYSWGACTEDANLFAAILYRVGIPTDRCANIVLKSTGVMSHHYVTTVYVYDYWLYFDATNIALGFPFSDPHSLPFNHPYDFEHPYEIYSAQNSVMWVPLVYKSINDPKPSPYIPFETEVDVSVYPGSGVSIHFSDLITEGDSNVEVVPGSPEPNFELVPEGSVYEITTDSDFDGPVIISINYDESQITGSEEDLELKHWDEIEDDWVVITTWVDTLNDTIYGETDHFSTFGIMIPKSPYHLKNNTIGILNDAKSSYKLIDKEIESVIKPIQKSLNSDFWINYTHLDPDYGNKVFINEQIAVAKLNCLIKNYQLNSSILEKEIEKYNNKGWNITVLLMKADALEKAVIAFNISLHKLVKADKYLAMNAMKDAENAEVKCVRNQKLVDFWLDKANKQLIKANLDYQDGKFVQTISHYMLAWKYAQNAMAWAERV